MKTYPDGGYGWVVVVSAGTILGLSVSVLKCSGQVYANLLQTRSYTRSQVATVIVLPPFFCYALAIFANKLAELYSFKFTLFLGSFLLGFGMCLSSFTTYNLGLFTLTFVIMGIGMAFAALPCSVITGLYFTKKRPLAMGIMISLSGIVPFFMPVVVQYFLDEYHLEGTLLLWGGILLHGCVAAMTIRQPTWALQKLQQKSNSKDETETFMEQQNQPNPTKIARIYSNLKMIIQQIVKDGRHFRNYLFLLQLGNRSAFFFSVMSVGLIIPQFAMEQIEEITSTKAAFLLSVLSISDVATRLVGGWINNFIPNRTVTYLTGLVCLAISAISFQFTYSYPAILVVCLVYGVFNAYLHVTYFLVMFDCFGPADTPGAIAIQFVVKSLFVLSSGPIMAGIRDLTGSYKHCFTFIAFILSLSVVLWLFKPEMLHCKCKQKKPNVIHSQNLNSS